MGYFARVLLSRVIWLFCEKSDAVADTIDGGRLARSDAAADGHTDSFWCDDDPNSDFPVLSTGSSADSGTVSSLRASSLSFFNRFWHELGDLPKCAANESKERLAAQ
ncbi:hypothetical protein EV127DRAFT_30743 [Xylaria flabelliformis]|nr:hypothetical protein EV127DRAFT_30743 [Xylaria flabelliformis]